MNRSETKKRLLSHETDILIVGAGINGAGTFRDLALNGIRVLLIDKSDYCAGASAASSHMAHGGIRYLENGEFRLVKEAVMERNRMIENAPHLVRPLPTVVPIFKLFSGLLNAPLKFLNLLNKPAERGAIVIKVGLILYDSFTRKQKTVPPHSFVGAEESLRKFPGLAPDIKYTATYYDGQILSPERYVVDLVMDGKKEGSHALALNYTSLHKFSSGVVTLKDEISGELSEIKPKIIINASGPWINQTIGEMGLERHYVGGTKGSHIIVENATLRSAIGKHEFFFENNDGRIVLVFPFFDKVIIGTSDLPIEDPSTARITDSEIAYFLTLVSRIFPRIEVSREQIIFSFTGVRPLESMKAKTAAQITRDHSIKVDTIFGTKIFSLVGGKWTSYRAFSEQVTDVCLRELGINRRNHTRELAIGGGKNYPQVGLAQIEFIKQIANPLGRKIVDARGLFDRYGTLAAEISRFIAQGTPTPLASLPGFTDREIEYLAKFEDVAHIEDILLRRTNLAWLGFYKLNTIKEVGAILSSALSWDDTKLADEVRRTVEILKANHNVEAG